MHPPVNRQTTPMRPFLAAILLPALLATACSKTNTSPGLVGVWKMVDYRVGSSVVAAPADSALIMYLWSNSRYLQVSAGAVMDSGIYMYDNIPTISNTGSQSSTLQFNSRKFLEGSPPFLVSLHRDTLSLSVNASDPPVYRYLRVSLF
jgi:hypothetical protein